jgi:hypothetical protein
VDNFRVDIPLALFWLAALACVLLRFRSIYTALLLGALPPCLAMTVSISFQSGNRYFMPMYPIMMLAAGAVAVRLIRGRDGDVPDWPEPAPATSGGRTAGTPGREIGDPGRVAEEPAAV